MLPLSCGLLVVLLACVCDGQSPYRSRFPTRPTLKTCEAPYLKHGSIVRRQRGRTVEYMCDATFELIGSRFSVCMSGIWDRPVPLCAKGGCSKPKPAKNGIIEPGEGVFSVLLFCLPGFEVTGAREAFCDGSTWDRQLGSCRETRVGPQTSCDFESVTICGWTNDDSHDVNWIRSSGSQWRQGRPPRSGTTHDHTIGKPLQGHFMTVGSLRHVRYGGGRLLSPVYNSTYSRGCFRFFYHMYGASVSNLSVYQMPISLRQPVTLLEISGNKGNIWHRVDLTLQPSSEPFQIIFEASMAATSTDVAVDDVELTMCGSQVTEEGTEPTVSTTEEEGGIFSVDSCRDRCSENASVAINGSLVKDQADEGISLKCDCHSECLDLNSCCPDYMEVCLASGNPTSLPEIATAKFDPIYWAILAGSVSAIGTILVGLFYCQRRRKIRQAPGCGDVVFERRRDGQEEDDSDIKCLTSMDDEELDFTLMKA
ncbi:uncharacterized protein LOC132265959 [Phlebotomus argentipes]|uniref:uncharacterized protein LOC132265959 n=1 Tax=Phlebotomus argentipes TaxID=94469 RepID=UPI002892A648|nr:uncharacterized protein LOC132265959 [Phlebotomus argentipes]